MKYIGNAFSLSMLPESGEHRVRVRWVSVEEARQALLGGFVSAIGHQATAEVFSALLGLDVATNRVAIRLEPGDVLVVGQLMSRLPEGQVLDRQQLEALPVKWALVFLEPAGVKPSRANFFGRGTMNKKKNMVKAYVFSYNVVQTGRTVWDVMSMKKFKATPERGGIEGIDYVLISRPVTWKKIRELLDRFFGNDQ